MFNRIGMVSVLTGIMLIVSACGSKPTAVETKAPEQPKQAAAAPANVPEAKVEPAQKVIVNMLDIASKSEAEVIAKLGEPTKRIKATSKISTSKEKVDTIAFIYDGVDVEFYGGKSVKIVVTPKDVLFPKDPQKILSMIGLTEKKPDITNQLNSIWNKHQNISNIEALNKDDKINYIRATIDERFK
jgi:flagellar basal body-associated protein FliL